MSDEILKTSDAVLLIMQSYILSLPSYQRFYHEETRALLTRVQDNMGDKRPSLLLTCKGNKRDGEKIIIGQLV